VLQDHWQRNGPPQASRLARTPSVYPIPVQPARQVQSNQPISAKRTPSSSTPSQPNPKQSTRAPAEMAPPQQMPTQVTTIHSVPAQPDPPLTVSPVPSAPLALAPPQVNQSLPRSSYPSAWQDLIDHAGTYILHDMLFSHPFPSGVDGQKWAREAVSAVFASYGHTYSIYLDRQSCESLVARILLSLTFQTVDQHRSNIVNLVSIADIYICFLY